MPPDLTHDNAPPLARRGVEMSQAHGHGLPRNDSTTGALDALRSWLPTIALETRVALDVARDLWFTGGCDEADGRRLRTAHDRIKRAVEIVEAAEREVRQ